MRIRGFLRADWTDTTPEAQHTRTERERALTERTEAQLTPILDALMTDLRQAGLSEAQLLWWAINIVESAMGTIQERARGGSRPSAQPSWAELP